MKYWMVLALAGVLAAQDKDKAKDEKEQLPGSISGRVTQAGSGEPMKNVEIWANRNSPQALEAVTDDQGRYTLRNVPPGQIRISANAPDSNGRVGFGPNATRLIMLPPGQDLPNVDFRLVVQAIISGKVIDQNKEPVVGASVFLVAREYSHGVLRSVFASGSITDDQGEYSISRVPPGRAFAVLAQKRFRSLPAVSDEPVEPGARLPAIVPTYHPNARSIDGAELLSLRPGERRDNVDIQLTRSPSFCLDFQIEGTPNPKGMGFNIAEAQPASGEWGNGGFYSATPYGNSRPDGTGRVCELHPGEYELSASEYKGGGMNGMAAFGSTIVTIGDRDVAGVRVALRGKIPVKGEVVFDGPAPEPPLADTLSVNLQSITRTERASARPEIPGTFDFGDGLVMDDFGVNITRVPRALYIKDVTFGGQSILYSSMKVGSTVGDAALKIVLARNGGTVNAHVADKDGVPAADCGVVVMPPGAPNEAVFAAMLVSGRTDQRGAWTSASLAPGRYLVLAFTDRFDRSPETIGKLWKARNRAEEIEIAPGGAAAVTIAPKELQ